jgi:hypothetical protein
VTPPEELHERTAARRGRGLRALLLGLLGALIGGPLGYVAGALMAELLVCRNGGGGESCGTASMIFSFLGIPFGAAIGAIIGVYAIMRQPPDAGSTAEVGADASPARER